MVVKPPKALLYFGEKKESKKEKERVQKKEHSPLVSSKGIPVPSKRCFRKLRAVLECPIRVKGAKEGRDEWPTNNKCTFQEGERKKYSEIMLRHSFPHCAACALLQALYVYINPSLFIQQKF